MWKYHIYLSDKNDSFLMDQISVGFDIDSDRNLGCRKNEANKVQQNLEPKWKVYFGQVYAENPKILFQHPQTKDQDTWLNKWYKIR